LSREDLRSVTGAAENGAGLAMMDITRLETKTKKISCILEEIVGAQLEKLPAL